MKTKEIKTTIEVNGKTIKIGDEIKIIAMKCEPQYTGKVGIIERIDAVGQLHGTWGSCAIIPEVDEFKIIRSD